MAVPSANPDHQAALDALTAAPGVALVLGAVDVGKTTLVLQAANRALERGLRVGVIDADVGQSEIGPPGTIGLALPEAPAASATEWRAAALGFVGSTAPIGRLLDVVVGVRRLVDEARRRGAEWVMVDTSGLVHGAAAVKLKLAKLEVLQPDHVLLLRRGRELDPLLRLVPAACRASVTVLAPSEAATSKPPALRRARRAARFAHYLKDARPHVIDARRVVATDGWLFTGRTVEPARLRAASTALQVDVIHGEETPEGIRLATRRAVSQFPHAALRELFGSRRIGITPVTVFQNLLVGLMEEGGRLVEIGLLQDVDFAAGLLHVLTPLRSQGALRVLRYGRVRLRANGSEIGPVRPGDL
jgi:polynucleotide 5'-hydroxyl-kinase GRC3/NOL9